ncbi:protein-glutamate O-methyltransferase CheR [uncultured Thermanaerothrix sp.]|uniref:CheR family methyltransferase n=1 Tax=uncultured Thermanaerothrix sp. TaxID=1195149 RepID=UPI0026051E6A|nr:protein-glutamate O-methyltransferase CheR [uncultured Thermanaerothrix sp.]
MERLEYERVKASIKTLLGIDLSYYKDEQMRRRLDSWLARSSKASWEDYFAWIHKDEREQQRLRDYLTINVSEFFRDPERWELLRTHVLPRLLQEQRQTHRPRLRIWSAGCSTGQEAYSLAMLCDDIGVRPAPYLLATDLDRGALKKAVARGPYNVEEVRHVSPSFLQRYFEPGGPPYLVRENLAQKVIFREQNLLADPFEGDFDLIVCRNVVIYFTNEAKETLYRKFHQALRPGGFLFLGGTELIPHPQIYGFASFQISFYMKKVV